jgi:hypothetical protein
MRWLALPLFGSLLLLSFSAGRAQDKEKLVDSPFYPLAVGNSWTYKTGDGNKFTTKVTAHEKVGDFLCARVVLLTDNKQQGYELLGVVKDRAKEGLEDGLYRFVFDGVKPDKPILLLKLPPKANDKWTTESKALNETLKGTFKVAEEEVKVPAGTFKAFTVSTDDLDANGLKISSATSYAADKGMVKQVIKIGTNTTTVELEKFEPAKK